METLRKEWKKVSELQYELWIENKKAGSLQIEYSAMSQKATLHTPQGTFYLKTKGFWQSKTQIEDKNGIIVLEVFAEKWYANYWTIRVGERKFKLLLRNNPLAEYAIFENNKELIAYGLDAKSSEKVATKITHSVELTHIHFLFDYLLWYFFMPIALENGADTFLLLMLLTSN